MEAQTTGKALRKSKDEYTEIKAMVMHGIYLLCGIIISRGALMGDLSPFGASYVSAVPKKQLLWALSGTALGYIALNPQNSFRYIAIIIAIGCMRWMISDIKKVAQSRMFACVSAFVPVLVTGVVLSFTSSSPTMLTHTLIEACLAGTGAFFLKQTTEMYYSKRTIKTFSQQEMASLVMTGCILILSLGSLAVENISVGRIFAVMIILFCARYGSVTGGSVSGIATGSIFSLSAYSMAFLCGGYAFGGLMAGLFSGIGKAGCAIAFTVCSTIMTFSSGDSNLITSIFIETVIASTVFMILPKQIGNFVSAIFLPEDSTKSNEALKHNVVMRLDFASKAMEGVTDCVNKVSDKLKRLYSPTMDWVYENVCNEVCSNCGLKVYCWDKEKALTKDDFGRLTNILQKEGRVSVEAMDVLFTKKCCKQQEIASSVNYHYNEFLSCQEAQRRVTGVRSVVAGQFSGMSAFLKDMSNEFENYVTYDTESSQRVEEFLHYSGLVPMECSCVLDKNGRMTVDVLLAKNYKNTLRKGVLTNEISKCCGRRFDSPVITELGNRVRLAFNEIPYYDVEIGSAQHTCNNGKLCGDCLNYFNNSFGNMVAMISDGMGTGGRAAVDGNMAVSIMTKLCKAGLSYDCALQVVNSALMVKSEDESLATLDIADINLFTGKVTLLKAGSPLTYIKKNGNIIKKQAESLPAGILTDIKFSKETIGLSAGDWVVMISDGAVQKDDMWLTSLIKTWNEASASDLAQKIVKEASNRRTDGHDDDITAIAIRILDNP